MCNYLFEYCGNGKKEQKLVDYETPNLFYQELLKPDRDQEKIENYYQELRKSKQDSLLIFIPNHQDEYGKYALSNQTLLNICVAFELLDYTKELLEDKPPLTSLHYDPTKQPFESIYITTPQLALNKGNPEILKAFLECPFLDETVQRQISDKLLNYDLAPAFVKTMAGFAG